jgi:recombinational DNA repair protein (RecF pathway)
MREVKDMPKKLGKCARCPEKLVAGHFHNMNGARLCDNCYPYVKDPESGRLMYKKPIVSPEVVAEHKIVIGSAIPIIEEPKKEQP